MVPRDLSLRASGNILALFIVILPVGSLLGRDWAFAILATGIANGMAGNVEVILASVVRIPPNAAMGSSVSALVTAKRPLITGLSWTWALLTDLLQVGHSSRARLLDHVNNHGFDRKLFHLPLNGGFRNPVRPVKLLTKVEMRRIAANIAKLPELTAKI